ncbi:MAG: mechanosensitive ion channel protein MscS [Micavibrio sp.]|nr:mechanosensitive ion channel protein MscS [Micavibrio sp.]|tara:strand:+ start:228 stop:1058 length:831 start_codon:yes stop_codon:yes gene_type:complete
MEAEVTGIMDIILVWGMRIISALAILIAGWVGGSFISNRIKSLKKLDPTISGFLGGFVKYAIMAVAVIAVLGQFGVQTASLLAVLGAAGLAIGLALQGTLSNVASGTMLLILRPFGVGDYIEFGSMGGTVKSLGLFGTELATVDNKYVFAPNSSIWGTEIINYSRNKQRRQDITVGISYGDDINKAFKTINKVLKKEKRLIETKGKEPVLAVEAMNASSVDIKVRIWTKTEDFFGVQWDLLKAIKEELDKDGITIPFPTTTMVIENPQAIATNKAA